MNHNTKRWICNGLPFDTWAEANRERNLTGKPIGYDTIQGPSCTRHKTPVVSYRTTTRHLGRLLKVVLQ